MTTPFEDPSSDTSTLIFKCLPLQDLMGCQQVCKKWKTSLRENDTVWCGWSAVMSENTTVVPDLEASDKQAKKKQKTEQEPPPAKGAGYKAFKANYLEHALCMNFLSKCMKLRFDRKRVQRVKALQRRYDVVLPLSLRLFFMRNSINFLASNGYRSDNQLVKIVRLKPRIVDDEIHLVFMNDTEATFFYETRWPLSRRYNPPVDPPVYILERNPPGLPRHPYNRDILKESGIYDDDDSSDEEDAWLNNVDHRLHSRKTKKVEGKFASHHFSAFWVGLSQAEEENNQEQSDDDWMDFYY